MIEYTSCGLPDIWLRNGYTIRETAYGEAMSIHNLEGLHDAIGLSLVNNTPQLNGNELRFLRKELDLSQIDLGRLLGVSDGTIRGWENERTTVSAPADRLLRVLYIEHVNGNGLIREKIEQISQLNRDIHRARVELEETNGNWFAAAA